MDAIKPSKYSRMGISPFGGWAWKTDKAITNIKAKRGKKKSMASASRKANRGK